MKTTFLMYGILFSLLALTIKPVSAALIISEIYPAPESGSNEWVELYNQSSTVHLGGYALTDAANNTIPLPDIALEADTFLVATASSILNNSGDVIILWNGSNKIYTAEYPDGADSNNSFIQCFGEWVSTHNISQGFENPLCEKTTPTPLSTPPITNTLTSTISQTPKVTNTQNKDRDDIAKDTPVPTQIHEESPSVLSFSSKHTVTTIPVQTTTLTPVSPSPTPTEIVLEKADVKTGRIVGALLLLTAGLGYLAYRLARYIHSRYNEDHETDTMEDFS